ncbi:MAG: HisA/HisF-related TIM barrel protein, partial [Schaalia hyovaginalis]
MSRLILLPAVDVVDGKAVRLTRGEAGTETDYGHPLEAARSFAEAGAQWLHLVDLDAAFGRGSNAPLLMEITKELPINVELSGGIRDDASLARALEAGARRVNLGTAALEDPEWTEAVIKEFGDRIAVGLDVRGETLSARGWTRDGGDLFETLERLN